MGAQVQGLLAGKRALVTGGNTGIGAATAKALAAAGARVLIDYVAEADAAERVVAAIADAGGEAAAFEADVSNPAAVAALFGAMDERWGGIDILVNNAGVEGPRVSTWELAPEAWRKVFDVNLFGSFLCGREAVARMVRQRSGVVINVTSVHEVIAWSGYAAYNASKAGLSMLTKTMAQEAAPFGVRVVAVAPGAVRTEINEQVWEAKASAADLRAKIPMGRMGTPEEVAAVIVMLASDVGSYVTGTTVFVDGGMTQYPAFMHGG